MAKTSGMTDSYRQVLEDQARMRNGGQISDID